MKQFLISSNSEVSHDCGPHWQSTMLSVKSREGDGRGMRWAHFEYEGEWPASLCRGQVRSCGKGGRGGDRSSTITCIRILTFKIAIRNHFSTHCCLDADELHFQTEK